jgi:hypothetical protein
MLFTNEIIEADGEAPAPAKLAACSLPLAAYQKP